MYYEINGSSFPIPIEKKWTTFPIPFFLVLMSWPVSDACRVSAIIVWSSFMILLMFSFFFSLFLFPLIIPTRGAFGVNGKDWEMQYATSSSNNTFLYLSSWLFQKKRTKTCPAEQKMFELSLLQPEAILVAKQIHSYVSELKAHSAE